MYVVRKWFASFPRNRRCESLCFIRKLTARRAPLPITKEARTVKCAPVKSLSVARDQKSLTVSWLHCPPTSYHAVWLQYQRWCPECRTVADEAPFYNPQKLLPNYTIKSAVMKDSYLHLEWREKEQGRSHNSKLPLWYLEKHIYWEDGRSVIPHEVKWEALKHPEPVEYDNFMSSDEVVFEFLLTAASAWSVSNAQERPS